MTRKQFISSASAAIAGFASPALAAGKRRFRAALVKGGDFFTEKKTSALKAKLSATESKEEALALLDRIEAVMRAEYANVEAAIPVAELDSRLGWEPSMEYTGDAACLRWKLRQLDYELNTTLKVYRKAGTLGTPENALYADAPTIIFH